MPGGADFRTRAVKSTVSSSESIRRARTAGSTRRIFAVALSAAAPSAVTSPARRAATSPSMTATASSSVSMSGGSLYPGASRYPP